MENKLCEENLLKIYDRGSWKQYIGLKENRNFSYEQSYGIEKMEDGSYAVFIGGEQNDRGGLKKSTFVQSKNTLNLSSCTSNC